MHLLEGQCHVIAFLAIPGVLFIKLLRLVEEGKAVMNIRFSCLRQIIILADNLNRFFEINLEPDFIVPLLKEILKSFVEDDR